MHFNMADTFPPVSYFTDPNKLCRVQMDWGWIKLNQLSLGNGRVGDAVRHYGENARFMAAISINIVVIR